MLQGEVSVHGLLQHEIGSTWEQGNIIASTEVCENRMLMCNLLSPQNKQEVCPGCKAGLTGELGTDVALTRIKYCK
jgi:hypothetical protein